MTWLLGSGTALVGAPTIVRLAGDHGLQWLVLAVAVLPLLVPVLLVLSIAQLVLHRHRLALLTAALLAVNAVWLAPLFVANRVRTGQALSVLTANLRFGRADAAALVTLVKAHRVDVLAVEELTPEEVRRLRTAGLERELPYAELLPFREADGSGLWSRFPLVGLPAFHARFQSPAAQITLPGGDVVVHVLHPFPTNLGGAGEYRRDYATLTAQVRRLDPGLPTVLAGDFNATADQSALRDLMGSQFRDASELAGSGFQRTWTPRLGWPALLHLDHVLVNARIDARSTRVLRLAGSDHWALLARLVLT